MARITVIDDEPRLLKTLQRILQGAGYEVRIAENFSDVDQELHPGRFDVLISDILMPGHSGIDVLRTLSERKCHEPVVLMTGEPNIETASEAVRLGAFDYITKPVTKADLLMVVSKALRYVEIVRQRDRARERELALLKNLAAIGESASFLAHEIKTPITSLNQALRAVADKLEIEQAAVLKELVERLVRIEEIMRRTLSFAKPLELTLSEFPVKEVFEKAARHFSEIVKDRKDRLTFLPPGEDFELRMDKGLLEEVLVNLVQNALDASGGEGRVRVSCGTSEDGSARILVEDDGPGIPGGEEIRLFQLFHTTKEHGTGLGLPICKKILESHGARIFLAGDGDGVEDRKGLGGACFVLDSLPTAGQQ